jgi:diguanylate cyclase (GGDEF)-like protein
VGKVNRLAIVNTVAIKNHLRKIQFRGEWDKLISMVNSVDGFFVLIGLIAIVVFWIADGIVWRLISFMIAVMCGLLFGESLQSKRAAVRRGFRLPVLTVDSARQTDIGTSLVRSQEEGSEMKKLVFDDFQAHPRVTEITEEIQPKEEVLNELPDGIEDQAFALHEKTRSPATHQKHNDPAQKKTVSRQFQLSDFFDVDSELFQESSAEGSQPEPRNEFDFLLNKILAVMKDVVFAHTVAFFWANRDKQQMVCEASITDSMDFPSSRRFPISEDVISQIALSGKPELITHVNPTSEKELLRYYERVEFVKSFVGVPVFYPSQKNPQSPSVPVGVIVADSTMEDAFGQETIALLGQFTKLISVLIKTSTDKYDLLLDVELLNSIRRLQERIRNDFSVQTIVQSLAEESGKLLNWHFLSIILYDDVKRGWAIKKVINRVQESYIAPEELIDAEESIVGLAIKKNVHQLVQDLDSKELPRYYPGEKLEAGGSFVSIPISSLNKCYGALNIESCDRFNFSRKDIEILYRLAENTASALEILYLNEMIQEYVVVDSTTNAYTKRFFIKKLHEELQRADDYGTDLSLALLSIDNAHKIIERYGHSEFETVLADVVKILKTGIRTYDAVGQYDYNRLGVILVNTAANDAYIWGEKVRKTIASRIITVDGKSFSVTASIGVCGALEGMKTEEIIDHTTAVLHKGIESGGNAVRVY